VGDLADHLHGLAPGQAVHRDLGEVGPPYPRGTEVGTTGEQGEDMGSGTLVHQEIEQFQRGGIDPVQVFHDEEQWLLHGSA
jgi:hypothetical protein